MRTCNACVEGKHANPEIYSTGSMPLKHITILPHLPTPMHKTAKHKGKPTITLLKMICIFLCVHESCRSFDVNIKPSLSFPLLLISSTLTCTSSSHKQQMLLHCQMAYKANCTTLILCVASIKNWIETDKIRLCLQDLTKCKSLI